MSRRRPFYRGKYLIALYNEKDECVGVYANRREFSEAYYIANWRSKPKESSVDYILNRAWYGHKTTTFLANTKCTIHFIEIHPEEMESLE